MPGGLHNFDSCDAAPVALQSCLQFGAAPSCWASHVCTCTLVTLNGGSHSFCSQRFSSVLTCTPQCESVGCCRNNHVAPGSSSLSDLSYLAADKGLLLGQCPWRASMALELAGHTYCVVGVQFWSCHDLDTLAVQMAPTTRY